MDEISERIIKLLESSKQPMETREIEKSMKDVTRTKILNRLKDLRGDRKIGGKRIGAGARGVWVWWPI